MLTALTVCLTLGIGFAGDGKEDRSIPLPPDTIVAANWLHDGSWYALDGKAVACVRRLMEGKPYREPESIRWPLYRADTNTIILRGVKDNRLVQTEVIHFADGMALLWSSARTDRFETDDTPERTHLLNLLTRIKEGREKPVVQAPEIAEKPGQSNATENTGRKVRRGILKNRKTVGRKKDAVLPRPSKAISLAQHNGNMPG